jgi:hypothetical protein
MNTGRPPHQLVRLAPVPHFSLLPYPPLGSLTLIRLDGCEVSPHLTMRLSHAVVLATLGSTGFAGASVIVARADCTAHKIVSGDTCSGIASTRCGGISLDDLYSYNSGLRDKCSNLRVRAARCAPKHPDH